MQLFYLETNMKSIILFFLSFALFSAFSQVVPDYWNIKGNLSTNPSLHFLGTGDNVDLVFRTNNIEQARLTNTGLFFLPKQGMGVNVINAPTIPSTCGVFVANSPQVGAVNLLPFQEKGRYFYIVNYSGANLSLSHSVNVGINANSNIMGNGARWCIIWDGLKFIRIL